jgi:hypothetical protein
MVTNIFGTHIMFDGFADENATHTQVTKFAIALRPVISSRRTTPNE